MLQAPVVLFKRAAKKSKVTLIKWKRYARNYVMGDQSLKVSVEAEGVPS
jgi:hypothetical protein